MTFFAETSGVVRLNPVLVGFLTFLLGALLTHLWTRYRNRLRTFRWSVAYHKIAVAAEDREFGFGKVEVLHNGQPVTNLHTAVITVENESNSDFENVVLQIASRDDSIIISAFGFLEGSLQYLSFTDEYFHSLTTAKEDALQPLLRRVDYRVPVFNRGARGRFVLLVSRDDALQPNIVVGCERVGVRLKHEAPTVTLLGVPQLQAAMVGSLAALAITVLLAAKVSGVWKVGLAAWFLGIWGSLLGIGVIRFWRVLARLLS